MSNNEIWNEYLDNIKDEMSLMSFNTWFDEDNTKLYSFKNNVATITVKQEYVKKHLEENYLDIMIEAMRKVINSEVNINIVLEQDIKAIEEEKRKELRKIEKGNVHQSSDNANLNPNYTFDSFIVRDSNKFAYKAALVVAESPGTYNPLFLYGESGVGKTHLMHAIGNYLIENTDKKVLYIASDKFVDEYTRIFRFSEKNNFDRIDTFKEKYRNVDVLMIDDIQFLSTAPKGQEEFFHTFNELHAANKQIIIASDRSVDDLNSIENRLLTRLNWGLTANITTPDYKETAEDIPSNEIEYIANNFDKKNIEKIEKTICEDYIIDNKTKKELENFIKEEKIKLYRIKRNYELSLEEINENIKIKCYNYSMKISIKKNTYNYADLCEDFLINLDKNARILIEKKITYEFISNIIEIIKEVISFIDKIDTDLYVFSLKLENFDFEYKIITKPEEIINFYEKNEIYLKYKNIEKTDKKQDINQRINTSMNKKELKNKILKEEILEILKKEPSMLTIQQTKAKHQKLNKYTIEELSTAFRQLKNETKIIRIQDKGKEYYESFH